MSIELESESNKYLNERPNFYDEYSINATSIGIIGSKTQKVTAKQLFEKTKQDLARIVVNLYVEGMIKFGAAVDYENRIEDLEFSDYEYEEENEEDCYNNKINLYEEGHKLTPEEKSEFKTLLLERQERQKIGIISDMLTGITEFQCFPYDITKLKGKETEEEVIKIVSGKSVV